MKDYKWYHKNIIARDNCEQLYTSLLDNKKKCINSWKQPIKNESRINIISEQKQVMHKEIESVIQKCPEQNVLTNAFLIGF